MERQQGLEYKICGKVTAGMMFKFMLKREIARTAIGARHEAPRQRDYLVKHTERDGCAHGVACPLGDCMGLGKRNI